MKYQKIFLNVHFTITIAYRPTYFKFCLLSPHIHPERTVSQNLNLGLSIFMSKTGKHFRNLLRIIKLHKT